MDHFHLYGHDLKELHAGRSTPARIKYLRHLQVVSQKVDEVRPSRILDLGCAQGNFAISFAERGFEVVACDLRTSFLTYARLKDESKSVQFVGANAYRLPFQDGSFDFVLAGEILEHVAFPERLLQECYRTLEGNGWLLLTTPNGRNIFSRLPNFSSVVNRQVLSGIECAPDADGHLFLFTPTEVLNLLEYSGFRVIEFGLLKSSLLNNRIETLVQRLPLRISLAFDEHVNRIPALGSYLAEGMVVTARKPASEHRELG